MLATLDFINENAIEIGADFSVTITLLNAPNLNDYNGYCHVFNGQNKLLEPSIVITDIDTYKLNISHTDLVNQTAGIFDYDVLFVRSTNRFYANGGKFQLIKRLTII